MSNHVGAETVGFANAVVGDELHIGDDKQDARRLNTVLVQRPLGKS